MNAPSDSGPSLRPGLQPLVILGAPRSGTKLVRDLLGTSTHCTTVPYGLNHVWRVGLPHDAPDRRPAADGTEERVRRIRDALLDVAGAHHSPSPGYLVEKTCANTLRVPFVDRVLPDATFIHILRDGRDATVSAREQWNRPTSPGDYVKKLRSIPLRNVGYLRWYLGNLWHRAWDGERAQYWGPKYPGIRDDVNDRSVLEVCARQWRSCVSHCLDALSSIPESRVVSIRYEEFVTDQTVLDRLLEPFRLPDEDAVRDRYNAMVHDRSVGRWRHELRPSEQRAITAVLEPTLERIDTVTSSSES